MQKIVLFVEPCDEPCGAPLKVGNSLMNRFAVDEDAAFEILKIFELRNSSNGMSAEEKQQKGMYLIIIIDHLVCFRIMNRKEQFEAWSKCRALYVV